MKVFLNIWKLNSCVFLFLLWILFLSFLWRNVHKVRESLSWKSIQKNNLNNFFILSYQYPVQIFVPYLSKKCIIVKMSCFLFVFSFLDFLSYFFFSFFFNFAFCGWTWKSLRSFPTRAIRWLQPHLLILTTIYWSPSRSACRAVHPWWGGWGMAQDSSRQCCCSVCITQHWWRVAAETGAAIVCVLILTSARQKWKHLSPVTLLSSCQPTSTSQRVLLHCHVLEEEEGDHSK